MTGRGSYDLVNRWREKSSEPLEAATEGTMASGIGTIHVRRIRGHMVVQGDGQTPRGKRFIRATEVLRCKTPSDPDFKKELEAAVEEMLAQRPLPL